MHALADLIAPVRCVGCGAPGGDDLCPVCAHTVAPIVPPLCERCGTPGAGSSCAACADLGGFNRARSLVAYASPASRLALALKRHGRPALAGALGRLLADLATAHQMAGCGTVVTSVPAGGSARRRGYDHAELIGRATAAALGAPYRPLLVRAAEGPRQADVPLADRRRNVAGRFGSRPAPARVLVVDDVFTTGATAEACALALRGSGAGWVGVVTWARTLRRRAVSR